MEILNKNNNIEFLEDRTVNNKIRPWKEKKEQNALLSESYKRTKNKNKNARSRFCATSLVFKKDITGKSKLSSANFCQLRLCPMCSWRRSLKIFSQVSKVINSLNQEKKYRFIFLTLTTKNVFGDELEFQLDLLVKSFKKMFERKIVKESIKGYFRALEITHDINEFITKDMYYGNKSKHIYARKEYYKNKGLKIGDKNPNYNMYHPHFHIILMVNKSYFTDTRIYISHKEWTSLWQESLKVFYTPIVDVRIFKNSERNTAQHENKNIAEVAKYTVKDSEILIADKHKLTDETVYILDKVLACRRLVSFGALMKTEHKKLNLKDLNEDKNLINVGEDEEQNSKEVDYILEKFSWNIGYSNYIKVDFSK